MEPEGEGEPNLIVRYLTSIFGTAERSEEARLVVHPVVAFSPETSWEFGLNSLYVYYANDDEQNRLSEVGALAFVTLQGQFGLHLDHALYTDQDAWFFLGEGKLQSFPLLYYGVGRDTPESPRASVDEVAVLLRERALRRLAPSLYVGPELSLDRISSLRFNWADGVDPVLPRGAEGSFNIGLGLGLAYDSRHNVLNVRSGVFSELAVLHYNDLWGSDYTFWVFESDTRAFFPVTARDTLALQLFGRFTAGDVPFNELSTLGGESLMRGYYLGRFRDRHFVGAQAEYRFLPLPFTAPVLRRLGAAVFGATGAVFSDEAVPAADDLVWAGGVGLRFLLFPDKDVYVRGDLAFTAEGRAFYLYIGEAF